MSIDPHGLLDESEPKRRFGRKTAEQRAIDAQAREERAREEQEMQRMRLRDLQRDEFFRTPVGMARLAFEGGDHIFQYSIDVMNQQAIIVPMLGSSTSQKTTDPIAILNSVCREGWELLTGSFVFVEEGQQSRDKFLSSGQNVAIKGTTVGYYLFRRCEQNREQTMNPWEWQPPETSR